MMNLSYGIFDLVAQSCPLFFYNFPVRRGALFVFLKGVNKYGIKIYLPRLWDPFGL